MEHYFLHRCARGDMHACVHRAARHWKVSYPLMRFIVNRETGGTWNPKVTNYTSGAAGLAQFLPSTWARRWNRYRRHSPYNPKWASLALGLGLHLGHGSWWSV